MCLCLLQCGSEINNNKNYSNFLVTVLSCVLHDSDSIILYTLFQ